MIRVNTTQQIEYMRHSGKMTAAVLEYLIKYIDKNIYSTIKASTIDDLAREHTYDLGGELGFFGYQGFPASICISINNEIVHGIPTKSKILTDNDLIKLDFGVMYKGMVTDSAVTLSYSENQVHNKLINGTRTALEKALTVIAPHNNIGEIEFIIGKTLKQHSIFPVNDLAGHGVGEELHEYPTISNEGRNRKRPPRLNVGNTIAIEPIAAETSRFMVMADDNWTCLTADGGLAAQFEHTILVTENGNEVLTRRASEAY